MITSFGPFFTILVLMYIVIYFEQLPNWLIMPLAIINGFFLVKIFIIQHDCGHQSFTPNKKANNVIWKICSVISLIPYSYRAKSHSFHHNHNNKLWEHRDIGDIMTYTVEEFKKLTAWGKLKYKAFRNPLVMFGIGPTWYILIQNRLPLITFEWRNKERRSLLWSNLLLIGIYVALGLIFGWKILVMAHLPIVLCFGIIAIWFFYVQHQHQETYKEWTDKRDYVMASIKWSSFYDLPRFFHRLTGNIGYHHIHHLNASIPNYELVRCFKENPVLQQLANRLTFAQSLSCLWNHLWDEKQQKMISFREYKRLYHH